MANMAKNITGTESRLIQNAGFFIVLVNSNLTIVKKLCMQHLLLVLALFVYRNEDVIERRTSNIK